MAPGATYGGHRPGTRAAPTHLVRSGHWPPTRGQSRDDPRVAQTDAARPSGRWRTGRHGRTDASGRATTATLARLGRGPPRSRRLTTPPHAVPPPDREPHPRRAPNT